MAIDPEGPEEPQVGLSTTVYGGPGLGQVGQVLRTVDLQHLPATSASGVSAVPATPQGVTPKP